MKLIDMLCGGDALHQLIVEFKGLLETINLQLGKILSMIEEPLRHAQALSGLIGLLQPLVTGLQGLVDTSAEELGDAGLADIVKISDPISDAIGFGGEVLQIGTSVLDTLPTPAQVQEIQSSFDDLVTVVQEYVEATA